MFESVFNFLLYFSVLLVYQRRHRKIDLFFIILLAYSMIALVGMLDYLIGIYNNQFDLSIFRLSYLFTIVLICISPFKKVDINTKPIYIFENGGILILMAFFIVVGIISAYFTLPKAIELQAMGDWASIREDVYSGNSSITLYDSQFERYSKNFYSYLQPFGSVMAFYQLTKPKINKLLTTLIFIIWLVNAYASATLVASRGMIMLLALKLLVLYVLFRKFIPKRRKKFLIFAAALVGVFFYGYTLAVTESRFGIDSSESLWRYFGHSMFSFDDGIMRTMHDYANGRYQFGWIYRLFGFDSSFDWEALGCTHGTAFMTFVGNIYVDFGPLFTIVMAVLMSLLAYHFTKKKAYDLSDIIIIIFMAQWYSEGIFVFPSDQSLLWLMAFVVYLMIKILENKSHEQKNRLSISPD